jgi:uncharacterized protein YndB with AHSA1/START domain
MTTTTASSEIEIIRVYDAPLNAVWDAWVDPRQVEQWWGPRGFTISTLQKDVRPGGTWTYTMHGPDGTDYPNRTLFLEVDERARLVYDHGATDDTPPVFRVTALFSEARGQTTLHMRMALPTPEAAAQTRQFIKAAGGDATWDRLAEYLQERLHDRDCFFISRSGHLRTRGAREDTRHGAMATLRCAHRRGAHDLHGRASRDDAWLDRLLRQARGHLQPEVAVSCTGSFSREHA